MKRIFCYFIEAVQLFPRRFALSLVFAVILTTMNAAVPVAMRFFIFQVTKADRYLIILIGILFFALYFLSKIVVNTAWHTSIDRFGGAYITHLVSSLEKKMAETSYSEIEQEQGGVIRNIIFTDVLNVFLVISHHIPSVLSAAMVIVASTVFSLFVEPRITAFICVAVLAGVFLSICGKRAITRTSGETNDRMKAYDSFCTQFVEMLPMIQTNDILKYYQSETRHRIGAFIQASVKADRPAVFWSDTVNGYHILFSFAVSALLVIPSAGSSVENLVFFTILANLILSEAQKISAMIQQIIKNFPSFSHIDRLRLLPCVDGEQELGPVETIVFSNVGFTYTAAKCPALRNVTCNFSKGDVIRLSGANGSGKSTFIKLLAGLYTPEEGQIKLNNVQIKEYSRESLNKEILYISQDEKCINGTVKNYLEMIAGAPVSDARFKELMDLAAWNEEDREITENGDSLSGGQRKKLYLMKLAVCANRASVFILDELAAELDTETTERYYDFLRNLVSKREKTIFIVDHGQIQPSLFTGELHFSDGVAVFHVNQTASNGAG